MKGWISVKKLLALLLMVAFICSLSFATVGCQSGDKDKDKDKKGEAKKDGEEKKGS
jgi:hypothetical protein